MPRTHWWRWKSAPSTESLREAIDEMMDVISDKKLILAGPFGYKLVKSYDQVVSLRDGTIAVVPTIALNGRQPADCDPFVFPGKVFPAGGAPSINSCRTEGLPYDIVVTACLEIASRLFGETLEVCSGEEAPEWEGYFRNPKA